MWRECPILEEIRRSGSPAYSSEIRTMDYRRFGRTSQNMPSRALHAPSLQHHLAVAVKPRSKSAVSTKLVHPS